MEQGTISANFIPYYTARLGGKKVEVDTSTIQEDERGRRRVAVRGKGRMLFILPVQLTNMRRIEEA